MGGFQQDVTAYSHACHQGLTVVVHPETVKIELTFEDEQGRLVMAQKITALLVHYRNDRFYTLQMVLEALSIKVVRARNGKETLRGAMPTTGLNRHRPARRQLDGCAGCRGQSR